MEKNIYVRHVNDDEVEDDGDHHQPPASGCIWGFMHALHYHHLHRHHKYQPTKHTKGKINPKSSLLLLDDDCDELMQLLEDRGKSSHSLVNHKSIRARIKALISETVSKQDNSKKHKSTSKLQRTYSIHYLQPSDQSISVSMNNALQDQLKKDEDLSIKVGNSRTKARLTKSGTFPSAAHWSHTRSLKSTKLDHKKNEIWLSPEESPPHYNNAQVPELVLPKYKLNFWARSWTLAYNNEFSFADQKSWLISQKPKPGWKEERNNSGMESNQRVMQKADEEVNGDAFCASPNQSSSYERNTEPSNEEELSKDTDEETDSRTSHDVCQYSSSKKPFTHRRSSSFNDSLNRCSQLFEGPGDAHQADWPIESVENHLFTEVNTTQDEKNQQAFSVIAEDISILDSSNEIVDEIVERRDATQTMQDVASSRVKMEKSDYSTQNGELDAQKLSQSDLYWDVLSSGSSSIADQDHPLLKEIEAYFQQQLESSKDDCSHHLLYDLIKEVIVWICDRPFRVYYKALLPSTTGFYHPLLLQNHILDKVYVNISKLLTRKPNRYQTLDDIVSEDLDKDVNWMNLASESNHVALQLENIILDELLQELISP